VYKLFEGNYYRNSNSWSSKYLVRNFMWIKIVNFVVSSIKKTRAWFRSRLMFMTHYFREFRLSLYFENAFGISISGQQKTVHCYDLFGKVKHDNRNVDDYYWQTHVLILNRFNFLKYNIMKFVELYIHAINLRSFHID